MNRPPAFQFYAKDWLSSTRIATMTPAEEGAYIRLLAHCWQSEDCTLPDDEQQLAILSRMGAQWLSYPEGTNPVRTCFTHHPSKKSRLINKRLYAEWKTLRAFYKERMESGRKGAISRWKRRTAEDGTANSSAIAEPMAQGMAKHGSSSSSSSSFLKNKNTSTKRAQVDVLNGYRNGFELFWRQYPKKRNKGAAEKVWTRLQPDDVLVGTMLSKLDQAKHTNDWQKERGQFIPYPASWLNAKGWEDEYQPPRKERLPL